MTSTPADSFSSQGATNLAQVLLRSGQDAAQQTCLHLLFSHKPDLSLTYGDLIGRSLPFSAALHAKGIESDEVVILILPHGEDLVAAFFGAILHGAIPSIMPFLTEKLHAEQYFRSLQSLFSITRPAAVVTYSEFKEQAQVAAAGGSIRTVLVAEDISASFSSGNHFDTSQLQELNGLDRPVSSLALLQHSSGTTGLQKGVALSHQAIFNQLVSYSQALRLEASDVIVSWLPLYHDMGLIAGFIMPILLRVPLVLISPFDWVRAPQRLLQAIHRFRGTLCWLPNFAYHFCAQKIRDRELEGIDLGCLRSVINCSEPMHWKSHAAFLRRFQPYGLREEALATSYAMAENVFAVTQGGIEDRITVDIIDATTFSASQLALPVNVSADDLADASTRVMRLLSAGKPIDGTRIRILSADGMDLPERHIGEIALQSNCLLTGYYRRPDLTEKAFLDGWYLTGDLGYLTNGELFVTGRKKDLIIVGGKNIYPQDLENLASEVQGVHPGRIVAFGVFNEDVGTEDVVLVAEIDDEIAGQTDTAGDRGVKNREHIAREIRQRVTRGSEVALRHVYLVDRNWLIKTSSGKVARSANKTKYLQETGSQ